jgi:pilus assembly protein CpaB
VATALRSAERKPNGERRAAGGLRDNVGWTVARDRGRRAGDRLQFRFKKSRIFVLGIAIVAGGIAAYLALQIGRPAAPPVIAAAPTATTQVLVASQEITVGQRLSPASLVWQAWPEQAVQSDYVTAAATPAAMTDMSGLVARVGFLPGDPIRREKLIEGSGGFLSATLDSGVRGVSVVVIAEAAAGGFISPNDHVDVVLTRTSAARGVGDVVPRSETILHDVQVLAINAQAGEPGTAERRSGPFAGQAIATLALGPADADLVASAAAIGKLSLLLRSGVDSSPAGATAQARDSVNQAIRLSSPFWLQ